MSQRFELFQCSGFAPHITSVAWKQLPPIVRVLMSADGTVTKSLEAFFWEPIEVVCVHQSSSDGELPNGAMAHAAFASDEPLWTRKVVLQGQNSRRAYVEASSFIAYGLLPHSLRDRLAEGELGIGGLVRELGLETYREILAVGQVPERARSSDSSLDQVWRTYCIRYRGQVLMQITETFLLSSFAE